MADSLFPISLPVAGMVCACCDRHVDDALKALPGVSNVVFNASTHRVYLDYDPGQISIKQMVRAVEEVGYLVMNAELTLQVLGITSPSCARRVEAALKELPGIEDAVVKPGPGTIRVRYVNGAVALSDMAHAVQQAGYEVEEAGGAARS